MSSPVASVQISPAALQLLLFVDRRPSTREQIRQVRRLLAELQADYAFDLKVIDVTEYPYLAERFRIVATPSLVKIAPDPKQTLAGSNLTQQLKHAWDRWYESVRKLAQDPAVPAESSESAHLVLEPIARTPLFAESTRAAIPEEDLGDRLMLPEDVEGVQRYAELIKLSDTVFQLRQDQEELIAQLHFKDQIIAMLAHDIRNPLTAAAIAVETLETDHQSAIHRLTPALQTQLFKQARAQLRNMNTMITDILEATRGTQAGVQIQPSAIDLAQVCQTVLQNLHSNLSLRDQTINTDIPSDLPTVYGDAEQIKQVITNLLDNAIKYSPQGGEIGLSILHRTTQKVQVTICDTGPGIPPENRVLIFEDRYRLERDVQQQGYGIGLSLCQRIVRAHYGQIWVDSVPQQGSCFHFTLPVYRTSV